MGNIIGAFSLFLFIMIFGGIPYFLKFLRKKIGGSDIWNLIKKEIQLWD